MRPAKASREGPVLRVLRQAAATCSNHRMALFTKTAGGYFLAHNSTVVGDVTVGELTSFWFNAVVRGDVAPVTIARRVNVQDGAVIHCDTGVPNVIEDDVT